jgi:hypothetical protein
VPASAALPKAPPAPADDDQAKERDTGVVTASYSPPQEPLATASDSVAGPLAPVNWDEEPLDLELREEFKSGAKTALFSDVAVMGCMPPKELREAPQKDFLKPWYAPGAESSPQNATEDPDKN